MLQALGIEKEEAREALLMFDNDLERASTWAFQVSVGRIKVSTPFLGSLPPPCRVHRALALPHSIVSLHINTHLVLN